MELPGIIDEMMEAGDAEKAVQMKAYMRDQFEFLGIKTPLRHTICKPYFKEAKKSQYIDWGFIDQCWGNTYREMQYVAADYLGVQQALLTANDMPRLKNLVVTKSWWDTVDSLDTIIGNIALRDPSVNASLLDWSVDENFWLRRVAIDHQLLRREKTDTTLLETILVNNLGQSEFFINKAIGWALREYSKTDPVWVRTFIEDHRSCMASLSIREASKYL